MNKKVELGQFFTKNNPFDNNIFKEWFQEANNNSKNKIILEPFAGNEDIIELLKLNHDFEYVGYDIQPIKKNTLERDTLKRYPKGYDIAITNPPYLAKNSSTRKKLSWIYDNFDDLYKVSLNKMLENNNYVAAIVPATLITSGLFKDRLTDYILLNMKMFHDTDMPVCLSLFKPNKSLDFKIWELNEKENKFIGTFYAIKNKLNDILEKKQDIKIKFNDVNGKYGILATDKSYKSIKFVKGDSIPENKVKKTSRNMVRFKMDSKISINKLNAKLNNFLKNDGEIFLSPFKNLRKDNKYRRRLDFNTIRRIIESC